MKDAVATMGTILDGQDVPDRDAVHVAVISTIAGDTLGPGDDVYFTDIQLIRLWNTLIIFTDDKTGKLRIDEVEY